MSGEIPKTMWAAVYHGANDVRVEQVPVPKIGANELLVKVAACGVCPTDIKKIQQGILPGPRIFGHETAGTIVRVGARVRGWREGERVALHHHVPCGKCHACRHAAFAQCAGYKRTGITAGYEPAGGGFAEYVRVMPFVFPGIVRIPRRNTFVEGAMLEPVNTVLKAVEKLGVTHGDTAWVIGQGPIGLIFTRILRLRGVRVIASDFLEWRLKLAREYGAEECLRADRPDFEERMAAVAKGRKGGIDAVVVAAPSDAAVRMGLDRVRGGGRVLLFAHTKRGGEGAVDFSAVCVDEKDLVGSYSADIRLQGAVAQLVFSRRLDVRGLVTHEFGLDKTAQAIALAADPKAGALKIFVRPERRGGEVEGGGEWTER